MKLTIVHPSVGKVPGKRYLRAWQMQPLPAAYLAGLTPPDVEITFWDDRMEPIDYDAPADLVAVSVETYTAKRAYQIASSYRRRGVPVVMGGFHATLVPEEVQQYAEAVVVGEAEELWPRLIADFQAGRLQRRYQSSSRPDISATMPDRSIFGRRRYFPMGLMDATRGCTYTCDFCAIQTFFQSTHNWRGTDVLLEEIRQLKKKHALLFFIDDNIMADRERAKAFFQALIPLNIRWISQADIMTTHDEETLRLMKASGCQGILIGFESLYEKNLHSMGKAFNTLHGGASEAVKKLQAHEICLYATFLFGYDDDTLSTFDEVLEFCVSHKIFITAFNHMTPFPGTPLYRRLQNEGRLVYDKWWLDKRYRYGQVPFRSGLSPEVIQQQCRNARAAFYSLRSIARRLTLSANRSSLPVLAAYLFINLVLRSDVSQRYSLPLGDPGFQEPLLPAGGAEPESGPGPHHG